MSSQFRVLVFGTDSFTTSTLSTFYKSFDRGLVKELALVCPEIGKNRVPESQRWFVERNLRTFRIPSMKGWELPRSEGADGAWDFGLVISFGQYIPSRIVKRFKFEMMNVHPSILPLYRGSSPIQHALLNGDTQTGISIIEIAKRMDHGKVFMQERFPIKRPDTNSTLVQNMGARAGDMLIEVLEDFEAVQGRAVAQTALHHQLVQEFGESYINSRALARKLEKADGQIDWEIHTPEEIYNRWRALYGLIPIACNLVGTRVLLVRVLDPQVPLRTIPNVTYEPGDGFYSRKDRAVLVKAKGGFVGLEAIKPSSGKSWAAIGRDKKTNKKLYKGLNTIMVH